MYYRLKAPWAFRGWKKLPYAIQAQYGAEKNKRPHFLKKEPFMDLLYCNGVEEVTLEELERSAADLEKLDDDELDAAGGMDPADESYREQAERRAKIINKDEYGNYTGCFGPWHCFAAMLHTETVVKTARCWNDYRCAMINKKIK